MALLTVKGSVSCRMLRTLIGNWGENEDHGPGMVRQRRIECKEEGAWVFVAEERALDGVPRKITSYGRSVRSFVRSVSSDVQFSEPFITQSNVIVEYPPESSSDLGRSSNDDGGVIITEVFDDEGAVPDVVNIPIMIDDRPVKKTSVVNLGKGNIVLIDAEESNFRVSAKPEDKPIETADRKPKRVEFCKTEVHFAPEAGKFNIVETDEKPPPNQIFRRKKKPKDRPPRMNSSNLPKVYFGDDKKDLLNLKNIDKPLVFNGASFATSTIESETIIPVQRVLDDSSGNSNYNGYSEINVVDSKPSSIGHPTRIQLEPITHHEENITLAENSALTNSNSRGLGIAYNRNGNGDSVCSSSGKKIEDIKAALGYSPGVKLGAEANMEPKAWTRPEGNLKSNLLLSDACGDNKKNVSDSKGGVPVSKVQSQVQNTGVSDCNFSVSNYLANRKVLSLSVHPIKVPASDFHKTEDIHYLGNVSPKLKNLIENSECREFNFRRKNSPQNGALRRSVASAPSPVPFTGKCRPDIIPVEKKLPERRGSLRSVGSSDYGIVRHKMPSKTKSPLENKSKISEKVCGSTRRECSRLKDAGGKSSTAVLRNPPKLRVEVESQVKIRQEKIKPPELAAEKPAKIVPSKTIIVETPPISNLLRLRRSREPLKSFEKVSNGWVGHCIVPVKKEPIYSSDSQSPKATIKLSATDDSTRSPDSRHCHSNITKLSLTPDSWKVHSNTRSLVPESSRIKSPVESWKAVKSSTTRISLTPDSWRIAKLPSTEQKTKATNVSETHKGATSPEITVRTLKNSRSTKSPDTTENHSEVWKAPSMTTTKLLGRQKTSGTRKSTVEIVSNREVWKCASDTKDGRETSSNHWKSSTTTKVGVLQEQDRPVPAVRKKLSSTPQSAPKPGKISSTPESWKIKRTTPGQEVKTVVSKSSRSPDPHTRQCKTPVDKIDAQNTGQPDRPVGTTASAY
ncbi:hypothetical protein AAG570_000064 [Ranatra chinensis]|uniref:Uncharacterized protein n=1 Tax=Ranatra chinensis TaxID=642074 RepID=A0ABD0YW03_9HEMI